VDDALGTVVWAPTVRTLTLFVLHGDFRASRGRSPRVRRHAGIANGIYRDGDLDRLRTDEWAY